MDASSSATILNNNLTSVVLNFNLNVLLNLFIYSAATTAGVTTIYKLITLAFEQILRVVDYKWISRYKDKSALAVEVIQICNEGSTSGWNVRPREIEHVYFISRLLERQDKKARELFDEIVGSWNLHAIHQGKSDPSKEESTFLLQLQSKAQDATDKLMEIVNKWK